MKTLKNKDMKKLILALISFAVLCIGCTKEMENQEKPAPSSEYLVIKAECAPLTKTDINEGKSTWEKGDIIELAYKGKVYTYSANEAGSNVYFSSEAGITDYDGSEIVAYYNAANAAEGKVAVEAEKTIEFVGEEQTNSACAPLVGTPTETKEENGVLGIVFNNIFSVIELRIDPTGKDSESPI